MQEFFYIKDFAYHPTNTRIIRLSGYYTDVNHNLFFPPSEMSSEEAIDTIKAGNVLFLYDGCRWKVFIKLMKIEAEEYLRVGYHHHVLDY